MAELLVDFITREVEQLPQIIGRGVLPLKGKMVLGGDPKANKSYIALNIGLDLAQGKNIFSAMYKSGTPVLPVTRRHSVLYVEQEIGERGLRERLKPMVATPGDIPFYIKTRDMGMRMDTPQGRTAIQAEIEQCRPEVVILDPLAKFHLSDENSAQQMGAIMRVGDHWVENYNVAIVYIHHTSKENFEHVRRGGARLRGSSVIFADVDTFIEVSRKSAAHHKEPVIELGFEVRQAEPLHPIFIKRLSSGLCEYLGDDFQWRSPSAELKLATSSYPNL